jgi:hypothetical protein
MGEHKVPLVSVCGEGKKYDSATKNQMQGKLKGGYGAKKVRKQQDCRQMAA